MGRRVFSQEFKLEAVKQIIDRGVPAAQAARDIEVHLTLVNRWVSELLRAGRLGRVRCLAACTR